MQNLVDRLLNSHNILSWSIPDLKNEKLVTDHRSRVKGFKTVSLLAVTLSPLCEQALNLFPFACGPRVTSREPPNGELDRARALDYITRLALNFLPFVWIYEWLSSTPTPLEACIENFYSSWLLSGRFGVWLILCFKNGTLYLSLMTQTSQRNFQKPRR